MRTLPAFSLILLALAGVSRAAPAPAPAGAITVTGKLTTGMMAIGGETTGIVISDGKNTFELDIKDALLQRKANELNGRDVKITGTLTVKAGIEVAQRKIITVTALDAAPAAGTAPATRPAPP